MPKLLRLLRVAAFLICVPAAIGAACTPESASLVDGHGTVRVREQARRGETLRDVLPTADPRSFQDGAWVSQPAASAFIAVVSSAMIITGAWITMLKRRLPQAERARQRSDERYRDIFERNPAGNFITRPDGAIVACNDRFARMLSFPDRASALAANAGALYTDPADREAFLVSLRAHGVVENREVALQRADGSTLYVLESAVARFNEHGELLEAEGYLIDLTPLKQAEAALLASEAQLRQAQRMEAMGRLAGGVAHDFNNLLTAIIGYTELVLDNDKLDESTHADLTEVRRSAMSAASLTRQLLAFSRKQVLEPTTLNVNVVVGDLERILRRVLGEDVSLVIQPSDAPAYVLADRGQLDQVLMNLVVNSRDAMPAGGRLELRVILEETNVLIEVSDTGCGIPPNVLPQIFEPFFTTKKAAEGTGLGLATVYGIVTQSGGTVDVQSEEGHGTTFAIRLPRCAALPQQEETIAPQKSKGRETILVVDDDAAVRALVQSVLERKGYRVLQADDGEEAVGIVHESTVDLVVTDLVMPQMNGVELASCVQNLRPSMKVLLMSGYAASPGGRTPALPPDVPFVQKPFTPTTLAATVRATLDAAPAA